MHPRKVALAILLIYLDPHFIEHKCNLRISLTRQIGMQCYSHVHL